MSQYKISRIVFSKFQSYLQRTNINLINANIVLDDNNKRWVDIIYETRNPYEQRFSPDALVKSKLWKNLSRKNKSEFVFQYEQELKDSYRLLINCRIRLQTKNVESPYSESYKKQVYILDYTERLYYDLKKEEHDRRWDYIGDKRIVFDSLGQFYDYITNIVSDTVGIWIEFDESINNAPLPNEIKQ